jgi:hypothetical protein
MLERRRNLFFWLFLCFQRIESLSQDLVSLPYPHDHITRSSYRNKVITITSDEYQQIQPCSFLGGSTKQRPPHAPSPHASSSHVHYQSTAQCSIELIEHKLVQKYINSSSIVLEIGGRYGTTSCTIASQLNNNGQLVVVEPDPRVWKSLDLNRQSHFCNFYFVKKPIGNSSVQIVGKNYDSISLPISGHHQNLPFDLSHRPNYYNYLDLEKVVKLTFNTLLIDCEGCLQTLFLSKYSPEIFPLKKILKNVNLILLEADNSLHRASPCVQSCVNYSEWVEKFDEVGLDVVERVEDKRFPWIEHLVFQRR